MKLLGNRVLIEPITPKSETPSGLILPDAARKQPFGIVRQLGSRMKEEALKVGDLVRVDTAYGSQDVKVNGKDWRIVSVLDVQAILTV